MRRRSDQPASLHRPISIWSSQHQYIREENQESLDASEWHTIAPGKTFFNQKVWPRFFCVFFFFFYFTPNISLWCASYEYPQNMFSERNKKTVFMHNALIWSYDWTTKIKGSSESVRVSHWFGTALFLYVTTISFHFARFHIFNPNPPLQPL